MSLTCGVAIAMTATASAAADGMLKVGTEGEAPPFSMADANGNVTGFDVDVANAICAKLKVKCAFVLQTYDTLIPAIDRKRFDVIISGLGITPERQKKIAFSIPYASSPQYFIVAKNSPLAKITSLDAIKKALADKTVGVVTGTIYARFIAKNIPTANIKSYDSLNQLESDLEAKRIDAAFDDAASWTDFLPTPAGADFARVNVKVVPSDDMTTLSPGMAVGLRLTDTALKQKIDDALCAIIKSGDMKAMSGKWFHDDYSLPCN
jgi:octopine/nopaline transport system substrate-binding protein